MSQTPGGRRPLACLDEGAPLSAIVGHLGVGFAEIDLKGRVIAATERFSDLVGRAAAPGGEGLNVRDAVHPDDLPAFDGMLSTLAAGEGSGACEVRLLPATRPALWIEFSGSTWPGEGPSVVLAATDITRRKQAEARAGETEQRFRQVADAAPVFIWTSGTDRQRRHTWVNARWTDFRGSPMEAELGSGWTRGVHPDDLPGCLSAYTDAFTSRRPFTVEYRLRGRDGRFVWILDAGTPMRDEHGRFIGYIGSSVDISDRKNAEAEREALLRAEQAARSDAERANQLKDEFLSILSHELRTPLNAMLGWVHLLRNSAQSESQLDRGLSVIERNARLQSRMIDDLLDMGGVIAGKMRLERRRVALASIVEAAVESLQPSFNAKNVSLHRLVAGASAEVEGDPSRLHQIVWNLLSNALKFTPSGGRVEIVIRNEDRHVQVVVRDDGPGIEPEFLPHVFERFRQGDPSTRRTHGGLGIGLALVKSLAELHGGTATAASEGPGRGSAFTVTLPRASGPHHRSQAEISSGTQLEGAYGS